MRGEQRLAAPPLPAAQTDLLGGPARLPHRRPQRLRRRKALGPQPLHHLILAGQPAPLRALHLLEGHPQGAQFLRPARRKLLTLRRRQPLHKVRNVRRPPLPILAHAPGRRGHRTHAIRVRLGLGHPVHRPHPRPQAEVDVCVIVADVRLRVTRRQPPAVARDIRIILGRRDHRPVMGGRHLGPHHPPQRVLLAVINPPLQMPLQQVRPPVRHRLAHRPQGMLGLAPCAAVLQRPEMGHRLGVSIHARPIGRAMPDLAWVACRASMESCPVAVFSAAANSAAAWARIVSGGGVAGVGGCAASPVWAWGSGIGVSPIDRAVRRAPDSRAHPSCRLPAVWHQWWSVRRF